MNKGDRARKIPLVEYGFRLPSALDNRPLTFAEWDSMIGQIIYVSATPGPYEEGRATQVVEQIIRPTGLVDPTIEVKQSHGQIDDLIAQMRRRIERHERCLITTLTKKMAEDLTDYLREAGIKVRYLHSDIDTLERVEIIRDLRLGVFDVLVGINLLREGLDLPEVSFIGILDADKEGYLRGYRSLIQTIGRAARNVFGHVVMYADRMSDAMEKAIAETDRRRAIQVAYNVDTTSRRSRSSRPCTRWNRIATSSRSAPRPSRRRPGCRPTRCCGSPRTWRRRCFARHATSSSSVRPSCATAWSSCAVASRVRTNPSPSARPRPPVAEVVRTERGSPRPTAVRLGSADPLA